MQLDNMKLSELLWVAVRPATKQEFLDAVKSCINGSLPSSFVLKPSSFQEFMGSSIPMLERAKDLFKNLDNGTPITPTLAKGGPKSLSRIITDKLEADWGAVAINYLPPEYEKMSFPAFIDAIVALIRADDTVNRVAATKDRLRETQRKERLRETAVLKIAAEVPKVARLNLMSVNGADDDAEDAHAILFALLGPGKIEDKACWPSTTPPHFKCQKPDCHFSHEPAVLRRHVEGNMTAAVAYMQAQLLMTNDQIIAFVTALLR
jgi:hypothetical protein